MIRLAKMLLVSCTVALSGSAVAAEEHIVKIVSDYENLRMAFEPKLITIKQGDTVTWVNQVEEEHNVVTYPDGFPNGASALISPILQKKGERWSYTFKVKGTYDYHCIPHLPMGMHGQVIVERPSTVAEYHKPSRDEVNAYRLQLEKYFDDDEFKYKPRAKRKKTARHNDGAHHHK